MCEFGVFVRLQRKRGKTDRRSGSKKNQWKKRRELRSYVFKCYLLFCVCWAFELYQKQPVSPLRAPANVYNNKTKNKTLVDTPTHNKTD